MLSFSNNMDLFNRSYDRHKKRLSKAALDTLKSSLQKIPLKNLENLYIRIFDFLIKECSPKEGIFSIINNGMIEISSDQLSYSMYNRLLSCHWPNERQFIKSKREKEIVEKEYRDCSSDKWWLGHIKSDNQYDPVKLQFQKVRIKYKKAQKKFLKIEKAFVCYRQSMIEFLVDVKIALNTLHEGNHLVYCFDRICSEIFNDNSEIKSVTSKSNSKSSLKEKILTGRQSFCSNLQSSDSSTSHQFNHIKKMEFY